MKFTFFSFLSFFIGAVWPVKGSAQNAESFLSPQQFQIYLDSLCKKEKLPGIMAVYAKKGQQYFYTSGYAVPSDNAPFNANTKFEAGSITKTFTAYLLMSVLRDYKITDTASIIDYLPDSVKQNFALAHITFLSLMNHTSGLPRLPLNMELKENEMQPYAAYDSKLLFAYLKNATPRTKFKYEYSNLGAAVAGVLAEKISGKQYGNLLDEYIFRPLKLSGSKFSAPNAYSKSTGYLDKNTPAEYWNMNVMAPAGSLVCTANEMMRYLSCMSQPRSQKSGAVIDTLLTPTANAGNNIKVGRGWHMTEQKTKPIIYWHNGGTYGFSTFCAFEKGSGNSVLVVVNQFDKNYVSDGLGFKLIKLLQAGE